tara:strand:- start:8772 stop:9461 length:690 start_codon:yes stop_codon:yes gene_type:complete
MSSSFLDLTNKTLRRLNEVEISQSDFGSVRGVQALAKDAIRAAVAKINQAEFEWPFNAAEHSQTLAVGQEEYSWPAYFKTVDWNSFQLQKDFSLGVDYTRLDFISRDVWYEDYRDEDYSAGSAGRSHPTKVFPGHGMGFGVTPAPDQAYTLKFRYYMNYADLVNHDDISRIPTAFEDVVIDGALHHMYMFRDNMDAAQLTQVSFLQGIKEMQSLLINKFHSVTDTRVKY